MLRKKHERLFRQGLNETHYDRFMSYFVDALHSLAIQGDLIEEAERTLGAIRHVFVEANNDNAVY